MKKHSRRTTAAILRRLAKMSSLSQMMGLNGRSNLKCDFFNLFEKMPFLAELQTFFLFFKYLVK